jgi:hypothetical protein
MSKDKTSSLAIDFSKFTDEDLEAYEKGDISALSDNALEAIATYEDEFNKLSDQVKSYKETEVPYGIATTAAGGAGAVAAGIAPRTSQKLVDKLMPEDLRGGYKAPAAPVVAKPPVAAAPGADYFSPYGAGEGAVKNATHNVDEVLKNKVAQAAIKTPGYTAPGNSLILQPSSSLPPPAAPATGSPVLPGAAKPKVGMPQMRAALQSPDITPANRLPSSIKGGAAAGFGANAIENLQQGNYGDAATSGVGSVSSLAAMASNPKLARAGKLGMAATILGKGYQALQGREEKAMGGVVGYAKGKAVKGGLEAAKKLFDPRFDKRVLEQEKLANQVLNTEKTGVQNIPKIYLPDYEGYGMVTSMSDRTAGGSRLLGVNDVTFNRPVELTGGQEYMYNNPGQVWASGKNPVNQIMREAVAVKKATGKDPLYMPWRMAPTASDFAHMTGETMLTHAQSAMGKAQKKDLDSTIKKFIPDWSGIDDPESMQQFMTASAKARKSIQNAIDRDLRGSGALSIGETRLAIADPNQLTAPEGGLMHVGRISADKPVIEASGNVTYPKGVPGEGMGQLDREHFVTEFLPEFVKERRIADPRSPGQTDIRALQMKPYSGIIDDKLLKSLGYAEGGSTSPAWQRKEGKNPEGGLNAAGRASYNRETGGNLKAPQPEGGPRKKSFCARMEGMKKKNTSSATANDPDSRINKSLRKWKC